MHINATVDPKSVTLGAALIVVGFIMGTLSQQRVVQAQVIPSESLCSPLGTRTHPTLITSSDDGKTLHFWSLEPAGTNKPMPGRGFYYQGSRSSTEES